MQFGPGDFENLPESDLNTLFRSISETSILVAVIRLASTLTLSIHCMSGVRPGGLGSSVYVLFMWSFHFCLKSARDFM